jgi:hypothetical protein
VPCAQGAMADKACGDSRQTLPAPSPCNFSSRCRRRAAQRLLPAAGAWRRPRDGIVTEPGRYVVACFIPTGIDPDVYLAAAKVAQCRPPELPADSGPHFVNDMYGEFIVA